MTAAFPLREKGIWPQKGTKGAKKDGELRFLFFVPFCGHSSFRNFIQRVVRVVIRHSGFVISPPNALRHRVFD